MALVRRFVLTNASLANKMQNFTIFTNLNFKTSDRLAYSS